VTASRALRLGTRASRLARVQAEIAVAALQSAGFEQSLVVVELTTRGDELSQRRPRGRWELADGQFTSELERALSANEIDIAVHSLKDLPTASDPSLRIGAVLVREDARDVLLTADGLEGRGHHGLEELPFGGRVATSSPRRAAQLAACRADLVASPIRGNVETRIERLRRGEYDGLLLAAAGLARLGLDVPDEALLPPDLMLPAPAQGALALQVRADDDRLCQRLAAVDHLPTRIAVEAERSLLRRIGGGCLAPLGALGEVSDGRLRLRAAFEDRSGLFVRADVGGPAVDPARVVEAAARTLLEAVAQPA
jgi:hydroxymethylbilane synthase